MHEFIFSGVYLLSVMQWCAEGGVGGATAPGHPAWGHPTTQFSEISVCKCLKMQEIKRKKVMTVGMQDRGASERRS